MSRVGICKACVDVDDADKDFIRKENAHAIFLMAHIFHSMNHYYKFIAIKNGNKEKKTSTI
jgi:hypothetical protein